MELYEAIKYHGLSYNEADEKGKHEIEILAKILSAIQEEIFKYDAVINISKHGGIQITSWNKEFTERINAILPKRSF
jgi:hypothetical protein